MKKFLFPLLLPLLIFACKNKEGIPNVSGIKADIKIERFDRDFFALDTNNIEAGLQQLSQKYPGFLPDFLYQVLGVEGSDPKPVIKTFLHGYTSIYDSLQLIP